jgi:DNA-binding transcriptional regulator YhcF (GntR family)
MMPTEITSHLRRRIVADLHLGKIKPGGRLPSLRTVSTELGVSIRAAARAYSELQTEGLVSVRGRSGIYLVLPPAIETELSPPLDWYAEMMADAWRHRLTLTDVSRLLDQLIEQPMMVACVESTTDHMEAFCAELAADFALQTMSVMITPEGARIGDQIMPLYDAFTDVDFIVTTAFHAVEVREVADRLKKPVVIVSANDSLVDVFEAQLERGPLTIIANDPLFIERFESSLRERFSDHHNLRVVLTADVERDPSLVEGATTLYTRAARKEMNESDDVLPAPLPFLSASAAKRVVQCMLSTHARRTLQPA